MKTKLVIALLALGMLTGTLMAATPARGAPTLTLDPPKYNPAYYVPGETIQFTVDVLAADPRVWDVAVIWFDGTNPIVNWSGNTFKDLSVPSPQNTVTRTWTLPANMPDGDTYFLVVADSGWLASNMTTGVVHDAIQFPVRTWLLTVNFSKTRYLPGDSVTVFWSANMIRDGSLPAEAYGYLWVWDRGPAGFHQFVPTTTGMTWPLQFPQPQGEFTFKLLGGILTTHWLTATAWFNGTAPPNPIIRFASAFAGPANIDGLQMMVNVPAATYQPGAVVPADINAKITDNPPVAGDPGAANTTVSVSVTYQVTGVELYPPTTGLLTDAHGKLRYVFSLPTSGIPDGTSFLVTAQGVANGAVFDNATDAFTVQSGAGLSMVVTYDKATYLSGDRVTLTAQVTGLPGPFTYTYEARDGGIGGPLLDRRTTATNTYSYDISRLFDGQITFAVTASDADGNRVGPVSRSFTVAFGIVTVNLDRVEYNAGDTITASYGLTSTAFNLGDSGVAVFYEVRDLSGVLAKAGNVTPATTGSFQFVVPSVPSDRYAFSVTVTRDGRSITSTDTFAYLVRGYFLVITPDKASYTPGETMTVTYQLVSRSARDPLPSAFTVSLAIPGLQTKTVQVSSPTGTLTYPLPQGMNPGQLPLTGTATIPGAGSVVSIEIVTVMAVNPLMADVGGVPAISVILLLLVIVILIVLFIMWRRMTPGMAAAPKPPMKETAPPPPPTAAPGPAPMTVACKACGAKIEITTSKRPIEVMCPSCGETQMVQ